MMTGDRVQAAAKALANEGGTPGSSIHSWRCEYPDRYGECGCVHDTAEIILAAVDEADRVAGVVRVDTSMVEPRVLHAVTGAIRTEDMTYTEAENLALDVMSALAALAATGAQPPPKEDDHG